MNEHDIPPDATEDVQVTTGHPQHPDEHAQPVPFEPFETFEVLAHIVALRRQALGLTQAQLAARMGTTASVISRIESGRHVTSFRTLHRLADALEARAVLGFEYHGDEQQHELVFL